LEIKNKKAEKHKKKHSSFSTFDISRKNSKHSSKRKKRRFSYYHFKVLQPVTTIKILGSTQLSHDIQDYFKK
jgi:hypothetical protein